MQIKNTPNTYGLVAVLLHWLVAITVIGLFALGWWMTGLDYYSSWYQQAPFIHKSIGLLLWLAVLMRALWRGVSVSPDDEPNTPRWQSRIAHSVHRLLYGMLLVILLSGYLISTADGRGIEVFGWFTVPAVISDLPDQEDIAGAVHWYIALAMMGLVLVHTLAALKHHFIDKDRTLMKMLGCLRK
ncbi:MAG: cytochrome b [Cellvibrionaceae bacterium]